MISLVLSPLIVMFLLWLIARHEAEFSYYVIFFLVLGVGIAATLAGSISPWLALAVTLAGLPFALARWCHVSLPKALLVTLLNFVLMVGLDMLIEALISLDASQTGG